MDVLGIRAFHGPNHRCHAPVLEVLVDGQGRRLPSLSDYFGGSGLEVRTDASPGMLLLDLTRALQSATGVPTEYAEVHPADQPGVERLTIQFDEETLARECLKAALRMIDVVAAGQPIDAASEIRKLLDLADHVRLGPSSLAIVQAAEARGIPTRQLKAGSLVQLGEGKHQRRTWTAETDTTSAVAESIASDKELTKRLLRVMGVPVPKGRPVQSADDAWLAAQEIGLPVAVKPRRANHARGISLDLTRHDQFAPAYEFAWEDGDHSGVMVEQFARGQAHRLLVVGEHMVAAARGESEHVTGDGVHTIRELVDEVNLDPRRGENYTDLLNVLKLDGGALIELQKKGLTPDSIPDDGRRVLVHPVGDLTTDVTELVHPANANHAVLAAKAVGLDIAGIDLVVEDISRPLEEQRGMVLEVNAGPSLSMHTAPLHGKPQPVGEAIVNLLFAPGETGRVPIVAVTGNGDRDSILEQVEGILQAGKASVGVASRKFVRVAGRPIPCHARTDADRVTALLLHPQVEAIVFEADPAEAEMSGWACSRCDLLIVAPGDSRQSATQCVDGMIAAARSVPTAGTMLLSRSTPNFEHIAAVCRGQVVEYSPSLIHELTSRLLLGQ